MSKQEQALSKVPSAADARWRTLADLLVFQGKLALDGLKDLVLSPLAIAAALYGVFAKRDDPGHYFRKVLRLGRGTERWIGLFSTIENEESGLDPYVRKVEGAVASATDAGVPRRIRDTVDRALDGSGPQ